MSMLLVVLIGIAGGLAGALQGQFLGLMEDRVGTLTSTFITYGGGGLANRGLVIIHVIMASVEALGNRCLTT